MGATADQLADDIAGVVAPSLGLLGSDLTQIVTERAEQAATRIVDELADPILGPAAAADVMDLLWRGPDPEDAYWWRTPLGRLVATALARRDPAETVTVQQAADMLGIPLGTMLSRTHRHPEQWKAVNGRVSRLAVLKALASS